MGHQLSIFLHLQASKRPQPLRSGNSGDGDPQNPPWSASSPPLSPLPFLLGLSLPLTPPHPRRGPECRSPRARSGASGTHARTWRAPDRVRTGRVRRKEFSGRSGRRASCWKLCSVNLTPARGGARPAAPAPGPAGSPGPRRPLPRGEGHASRERCAEELPGPAAPRPRTPRRHVASPRMFGGLKARWWKREAWRWRSDCRDWGNRVCIGPSCPSVFGCLFGGGVQAPSDLSPTSDAPKGSFPCMKAARMVPSSLLPSDS